MSHRSDLFLPRSSKVIIYEPAFFLTIKYLLIFTQGKYPRFHFLTAISYSKSLNTSLLDVMIYCKNGPVFICDVGDLTFRIMCDDWWASMNLSSKLHIGWNDSGHAPPRWYYSHYRCQETGRPGIVWIVCYQVLRHTSEQRTTWFRKHLLGNAHVAKWNKLTESAVTELTSFTVDETGLSILQNQGSRGILIVSVPIKFIFNL